MGNGEATLGQDGDLALETSLYLPMGAEVGPDGNLYVLDWNNHVVRAVRNGVVETVVGVMGEIGGASEGRPLEVRLNHPTDVTFDRDGTMLISAWHNSTVMRYDPAMRYLERVCGTGRRDFNGDGLPARETDLDLPSSLVLMPDGSHVISDQANQRLRRIDRDGTVTTIAGTGEPGYAGDGGLATDAKLSLPFAATAPPSGRIAADGDGTIYVADTGNHVVRRIDAEGTITTIAGTGEPGLGSSGDALAAALEHPTDVALDGSGNVYIADTGNSCVRRVSPEGRIETVAGICGERGYAGDGSRATQALLDRPYAVDLDNDKGTLYISDTFNHVIRAVAL